MIKDENKSNGNELTVSIMIKLIITIILFLIYVLLRCRRAIGEDVDR